jgi:two-component system, LuxR family, response regulator FixJ
VQRAYTLPVIIMTGYAEVHGVVCASQLGVVAFLQKHTFGETELWEAIQTAITLDSQRRSARQRQEDLRAQFAALSRTERQVLQMLLKGCDHMSISQSLSISRRTVENHRSRIMKRLAVETFIDLVALAYEIGLPETEL